MTDRPSHPAPSPELTELDQASAAMTSAPEDDTARMRFHERFADTELFLLLEGEPQGDQITPHLIETDDAAFVLAFDRPERLTRFTDRPSPYAALSGRALAQMLGGQSIGVALNLGAPSETLLPAETLDWLRMTLSKGPQDAQGRIVEIRPPAALPSRLHEALDRKLASARGLASQAWLVEALHDDDSRHSLLVILDPAPGAEPALAGAVNEALTFSGLDAGALDVSFAASSSEFATRLARVGLCFELPQPVPRRAAPKPPGMDPDIPPKLR